MKKIKEFDFKKSRRVTQKEVQLAQKSIGEKLGLLGGTEKRLLRVRRRRHSS